MAKIYLLGRPVSGDVDYYQDNIGDFIGIDLDAVIDAGIRFNIGVPDENGDVEVTKDFLDDDIIEFDSFGDLLDEYVGGVESEQEELLRLKDMSDKEIILEFDTVTMLFRVVDVDDVTDGVYDDIQDIYDEEDYSPEEVLEMALTMYPKLKPCVEKFIDKLESVVEFEEANVSMTNRAGVTSGFQVVKKGTAAETTYMKDGVIDESESGNGRDFSYENGFDRILKFMYSNLLQGSVLGIVVETDLEKVDKTNDLPPITKLYGFSILFDKEDAILVQLNSKDLYDCYIQDPDTGDVVEADSRMIYCGEDKDDIICGFDMV